MTTTAISPHMRRIKPGERGRKVLAYSECCCYMRVAGKEMDFLLKDTEYPMVQLYDADGREFSGSITTGECGLYQDSEGYYYYTNDHGC